MNLLFSVCAMPMPALIIQLLVIRFYRRGNCSSKKLNDRPGSPSLVIGHVKANVLSGALCTFSVRNQFVNMLGFRSHVVSVTTTHLYHLIMKQITYYANKWVWPYSNKTLFTTTGSQPESHCLLTPVPGPYILPQISLFCFVYHVYSSGSHL